MVRTLILGALALTLTAPLWAADMAATSELATQAQYWEAKGRADLARDSWAKLLKLEPDNTDALAGLANAEARSGRSREAQIYLDRLRKVDPNYKGLPAIEESIRLGAFDQTRLEEPRQLARDGDYDAAVAKFREVYGGKMPQGRLGLEYYQTLAGTQDGWQPARDGIASLVAANPADPLYKLALAQHLTYREETRREGLRDLQRLSESPAIALPAKQAWRQGLIWLGAKKGSDEPLYKAYLAKYGDDTLIASKLTALNKLGSGGVVVSTESGEVQSFGGYARNPNAPPSAEQIRGQKVRAAFDALNAEDLAGANAGFEAILAEAPRDADALGGLGILRLRQERYAESRTYLEQAIAAAPKSSSRWKEALNSARFWEQVRAGDSAREAGELAQAEKLYRNALATNPKELSVRITLADVLAEQRDTEGAETIYRNILREQPDNADAARGLIGIYTGSNRLAEALALAEKLPAKTKAQVGNLGAIKGQYLRQQAAEAMKAKDDAKAEVLLKEALLLDPESPWTRLDLARIYQRTGRSRDANTLIDGLLTAGQQFADAVYIKGLILAENQQWYQGLQLLEQVDPALRSREMAALQKRLWTRYQTERASIHAKRGLVQEAANILAEVEAQTPATTPELLGSLATAWADAGEEGRALMYMRQALARQSPADPGMRLQYASLLFKLRQDAEFEVVMEDLLRSQNWTEQQAIDLANMRIAHRLRQADLTREDGDLARAYEYLEPLLKVNPNDPRMLMALARLYNDAKEYPKVAALYDRVLAVDNQNLDAYKGAASAAMALGDYDRAEQFLDQAFALDPNNPRLYALAGRLARSRGDDGRALELFQQALRLDQEHGGVSEFGNDNRAAPKLYLLNPAPATAYPRASLDPPQGGALVKVRGPASPGFSISGLSPNLKARFLKAVHKAQRRAPRFIRTSTPADNSAYAPGSQGVWVQDGANRFTFRLQPSLMNAQDANAAQAPLAPYRGTASDSVPVPAQRGPVLGAPYSDPTLRSDVERDIRAIMGEPLAPAPRAAAPAAPTVRNRAITPEIYPTAPAVTVAPSVGVGASVQDYERQGLRVMPSSATGGAYAMPDLSPTTGKAIPPPYRYGPPVSLKQDPLLATPDFVLERRRPATPPNEMLAEIAELQARRSTWMGMGLSLRNRDGQNGLDKLTDIEIPLEFSFAAPLSGRFTLRAVPVFLDAGTVSGSELPLFGTLALVEDLEGRSFGQSANGVAVGGVYQTGDLRIDAGSSPLGFPLETIVGGINWRPKFGNYVVALDLARRMVTDSKLSYAGNFDPGLGITWGGVTKNGGRLDIAKDMGQYGVYGNGSFNVYDGENVEQNSAFELGAGFYMRALERRDMRITYGLNLTTFFFDKNLRRFTLGHGGYFSPQSYLALSVPVEWEGARNRFSYKLNGAIGLQGFREDGQALYPGFSALQAQVSELDEDVVKGYNAQSSTGLGFALGGAFEYLLTPSVVAGARAGFDNARDYNESYAQAYLRYYFQPQRRVSVPPATLYPHYNFGDPRL